MALVIYEGSDPKWFEENMGRGGAIPLGRRPAPPKSLPSEQQAVSPSLPQECIETEGQEALDSGTVASPPEKTEE